MDVSAAEVAIALVLLLCAVGAVYGARWVSRRSDEQMERTRAMLRARHAVPERPSASSQQVVVPQPARDESATRKLPRAEAAAVPGPRTAGGSAPAASAPAGSASAASAPAGSASAGSASAGSASVGSAPAGSAEVGSADMSPDDDPESSGRHRVPEELMRAVTYTLSPDRVARAKVPGPRPRRERDRLTDRRS